MSIEYDPKGKVFSQVVRKDAVYVRIQTVTHQITGEMYLRQDERIKDQLEIADKFIAVTSAKVYKLDGELAYDATFITLNRDHIIWLSLEDEPSN
ncbi:MAG: hypothetical protein HYZ49_07635 [Chloroflexi bacterium]|nr:hypothetical protein [Chloroflexota bacterium]